MNLESYGINVSKKEENIYRIDFVLDGKNRYRAAEVRDTAEEELLKELKGYILTGECTLKPIPEAFSRLRKLIKEAEEKKDYITVLEESVKEYEIEIKDLKETIRGLNSKLEALTFTQNKKDNSLSSVLSEEEYYYIMDSLKEYCDLRYSQSGHKTVRQLVLEKILKENPYENKIKEHAEKCKSIIKANYGKSMNALARDLKELGYIVVREGETHFKVYREGYETITIPIAGTPSDRRGCSNFLQSFINKFIK